ncbi:MAG: PAS domain-containing protein [Candidatus Magasanikbacteria bacterium]|nr:PAS domain-containing protein [Candidatus Magasanikbacteria bacterium]
MSLKLSDSTISKDVQTFMNAIGDGILIVDKSGVITKTNKAAWEMLGYKNAKQIEGKGALDLLKAVNNLGKLVTKKNAALFQSIKEGKKINNVIRQFLRADKKRFWSSITTTPIKNKAGTIKGAVIVIRDITEEKQAEEYRINFADIASHSLRTPLGNVLWANEYILSEKPGRLNKIQKEYLGESYKTLKSMNTMVNDLLSVSRLPDRRSKPALKKVRLEDSVDRVIESYDTYAKAQNLKIVFEKKKNKSHFIKADSKYLFIIIQNLIENAVRYAFDKTDVVIKIKKDGKHIVFSCTNKGMGIPKDKQKFIFAKFFRAENAMKKQGNGTGLGLYITYEMIRLNGGKIWFESTENKETTFFIQFNAY